MRIGVAGPDGIDDFAHNIWSCLDALGHESSMLGAAIPRPASKLVRGALDPAHRQPRIGTALERHIVKQAIRDEMDLVITVVSLRPETVSLLRAEGIPVCLWFPDHVGSLSPYWMFHAPYSAIFFKDPLLVQRITSQIEAPVHYLPEACNPAIHRPAPPDSQVEGCLAVVGNLHPLRARLLERLLSDGVPLKIYGPPAGLDRSALLRAAHQGRYLRGLEKSSVYGGAGAVLNNLMPSEMDGMNCRLFEATAAGGAVITERRPALAGLYEIGQEVLAYETYGELIANVRRVLGDPGLAADVGAAAARRALADHTYERRLTRMLEAIL